MFQTTNRWMSDIIWHQCRSSPSSTEFLQGIPQSLHFPNPTRDLDLTPTHESPVTDQGDTAGSPDLGLRSFNNKIPIPIDSPVVVDFLLGKCRKSSTNKPSLHGYWPTVRTLRNWSPRRNRCHGKRSALGVLFGAKNVPWDWQFWRLVGAARPPFPMDFDVNYRVSRIWPIATPVIHGEHEPDVLGKYMKVFSISSVFSNQGQLWYDCIVLSCRQSCGSFLAKSHAWPKGWPSWMWFGSLLA